MLHPGRVLNAKNCWDRILFGPRSSRFDEIVVAHSRAEQSRAEQSRAEQSRAEQSRAEQSSAEQSTP
jgi:hypothetical protein